MSSNEPSWPAPIQRRSGMHLFNRKSTHPSHRRSGSGSGRRSHSGSRNGTRRRDPEKNERGGGRNREGLPTHNHNGHRVTPGIEPDGESGRRGFNPWHFIRICFRSSCTASKWTNLLWPFVIAAMVLHFAFGNAEEYPHLQLWVFITAYIGMVPSANLLGFAGQELARKVPKVAGMILETTFGSVVEIILFMVLLKNGGRNNVPVIQAAILGSILANLLLCLGLCFFVGGIVWPQQTFHEAISEVGSNLMLVAGMGLVIPTVYYNSLTGRLKSEKLEQEAIKISHAAAIVLLVAFFMYVWFQSRSHHTLYEDILQADEELDHDRHRDLRKDKLTMTEAILGVALTITFVAFMAIFLVQKIEYIVEERGISDHFMGLILVPVVEKASEHLTAIDEAYDNQMNFALAHVLGASIQTALLNTPLVVIAGWGLHIDMSLNFELFDAVVIILAIIVVGNFLRDEKSDYLEGALCVFVYILIAITAYWYPDPLHPGETASAENSPTGSLHASEGGHEKMMLF